MPQHGQQQPSDTSRLTLAKRPFTPPDLRGDTPMQNHVALDAFTYDQYE
jgi:hypothetical protein